MFGDGDLTDAFAAERVIADPASVGDQDDMTFAWGCQRHQDASRIAWPTEGFLCQVVDDERRVVRERGSEVVSA